MPKKNQRKQYKSKLTHRQELFCRYYLGESNFNATNAAKRAGYRAKTEHGFHAIGSENLRKPEVSARISQLLAESGFSEHAVVKSLTDIATFDIRSILTIEEDGSVKFKNGIKDLPKGIPIAGIRVYKNQISEIRFIDPLRALEACAKMLGLFAQQISIDLRTDELVTGALSGKISIESLELLRGKLESISEGENDVQTASS